MSNQERQQLLERQRIFGFWLSNEIKKTELTQSFVAKKADINEVQLSRIVNGHSGARRKTIIKLIETINKYSTGYQIDEGEALRGAGYVPESDTSHFYQIAPGVIVNFEKSAGLTSEQIQKFLESSEYLLDGIKSGNKTFTINSNRIDMSEKYGSENVLTEDDLSRLQEESKKEEKKLKKTK